MTLEMGKTFPRRGGVFQVEPDASSGSYFWAASWLVASLSGAGAWATPSALPVQVAQWPTSGWQIDADFPKYLPLPARLSRQVHLGDSIMTAIALAPLAAMRRAESAPDAAVCFTDLGRLRAQECERVVALRTELSQCGARVVERGDTLEVFPSVMHGAEIETYDDHRMAMCFAILGLKVPGIKIKNPACVKKTFPDFFQKLAAPPPAGLGVSVLHGRSGERLKPADLGAE
jgi:3-phosphoshikimate 1-carboxyvinyltransferase